MGGEALRTRSEHSKKNQTVVIHQALHPRRIRAAVGAENDHMARRILQIPRLFCRYFGSLIYQVLSLFFHPAHSAQYYCHRQGVPQGETRCGQLRRPAVDYQIPTATLLQRNLVGSVGCWAGLLVTRDVFYNARCMAMALARQPPTRSKNKVRSLKTCISSAGKRRN